MSATRTLVWRPGCASCRAAEEFLTSNGLEFESVNPVEVDGQARWEQLGRPRIPSLVIDGHTTAIYHVSQVASLVGMTPGESAEAVRLAWDLAAVLEAWSDQLAAIGWETMIAPTPSRGRSIRNLTVNVHEPVHEMTVAWEHGTFTWDTDRDEARAGRLEDAPAVRSYAEAKTAEWIMFLTDLGDELGRRGRRCRAGTGAVVVRRAARRSRFHAAFHYRRLTTFLAERGEAGPPPLGLDRLDGLRLPETVFSNARASILRRRCDRLASPDRPGTVRPWHRASSSSGRASSGPVSAATRPARRRGDAPRGGGSRRGHDRLELRVGRRQPPVAGPLSRA